MQSRKIHRWNIMFFFVGTLLQGAGRELCAQAIPDEVPAIFEATKQFHEEGLAASWKVTHAEIERVYKLGAFGRIPLHDAIFESPRAFSKIERLALDSFSASQCDPGELGNLILSLQNVLNPKISVDDKTPLPAFPSEPQALMTMIAQVLCAAAHDIKKSHQFFAPEQQKLLSDWPRKFLDNYLCQIERNSATEFIHKNDLELCRIGRDERFMTPQGLAARIAFSLASQKARDAMVQAFRNAKPIATNPKGVKGDVLYAQETPFGLILVAGPGNNEYSLDVAPLLIVDLGGDDVYRGAVSSNQDLNHPLSMLLDLGGNDRYECREYGFASGIAGVGISIDCQGNDTYRLAKGSGGCGIAGIGILVDLQGNDVYEGSDFTIGAAYAGIGIVIDRAGDDIYASHMRSIGLGGCCGIGAVFDGSGDDQYQCGHKIPSDYNEPIWKVDDPSYQYEGFGMGMGFGRRIFPFPPPEQFPVTLAGGIGMLVDGKGNDRYRSSNFSQGCGYYYGIGIKLDLDGDDVHDAARYGIGSGAHTGVGLFIDYSGKDVYRSSGPTYNCGCAWDRSLALFADCGDGDDHYDLLLSSGLGRADHKSWTMFFEGGGNDIYHARGGASVSDKSTSLFFDAAGNDDYSKFGTARATNAANKKIINDKSGAIFVDQ